MVSRTSLLDALWGPAYAGDDHLVYVHVANLRRKLAEDPASPRFVESVRGVGCRLREAARSWALQFAPPTVHMALQPSPAARVPATCRSLVDTTDTVPASGLGTTTYSPSRVIET